MSNILDVSPPAVPGTIFNSAELHELAGHTASCGSSGTDDSARYSNFDVDSSSLFALQFNDEAVEEEFMARDRGGNYISVTVAGGIHSLGVLGTAVLYGHFSHSWMGWFQGSLGMGLIAVAVLNYFSCVRVANYYHGELLNEGKEKNKMNYDKIEAMLAKRFELFAVAYIAVSGMMSVVVYKQAEMCIDDYNGSAEEANRLCQAKIYPHTLLPALATLALFRVRFVRFMPFMVLIQGLQFVFRTLAPIDTNRQMATKIVVSLLVGVAFCAMTFVLEYFRRKDFRQFVLMKKAHFNAKQLSTQTHRFLLEFLPRSVVERLALGKPVFDFNPCASIACCEISDYAKWNTKLMPLDLVSITSSLIAAIDIVAERIHVEKVRTIGDQYLAATGMRGSDSENPVLALAMFSVYVHRVVVRLSRHMECGGLAFQIGIHTGPCIGAIICIDSLAYDVFGSVVSSAEQAARQAPPTETLISRDSIQTCGGAVSVDSQQPFCSINCLLCGSFDDDSGKNILAIDFFTLKASSIPSGTAVAGLQESADQLDRINAIAINKGGAVNNREQFIATQYRFFSESLMEARARSAHPLLDAYDYHQQTDEGAGKFGHQYAAAVAAAVENCEKQQWYDASLRFLNLGIRCAYDHFLQQFERIWFHYGTVLIGWVVFAIIVGLIAEAGFDDIAVQGLLLTPLLFAALHSTFLWGSVLPVWHLLFFWAPMAAVQLLLLPLPSRIVKNDTMYLLYVLGVFPFFSLSRVPWGYCVLSVIVACVVPNRIVAFASGSNYLSAYLIIPLFMACVSYMSFELRRTVCEAFQSSIQTAALLRAVEEESAVHEGILQMVVPRSTAPILLQLFSVGQAMADIEQYFSDLVLLRFRLEGFMQQVCTAASNEEAFAMLRSEYESIDNVLKKQQTLIMIHSAGDTFLVGGPIYFHVANISEEGRGTEEAGIILAQKKCDEVVTAASVGVDVICALKKAAAEGRRGFTLVGCVESAIGVFFGAASLKFDVLGSAVRSAHALLDAAPANFIGLHSTYVKWLENGGRQLPRWAGDAAVVGPRQWYVRGVGATTMHQLAV